MRTGWRSLIPLAALAFGVSVALGLVAGRDMRVAQDAPTGIVRAEAEATAASVPDWKPNVTGSALSRAAFGLSALQPETYNGEIVLDIIDASPLELGEKDRLSAKLLAAEAGHAELPDVLEDIRLALAVE